MAAEFATSPRGILRMPTTAFSQPQQPQQQDMSRSWYGASDSILSGPGTSNIRSQVEDMAPINVSSSPRYKPSPATGSMPSGTPSEPQTEEGRFPNAIDYACKITEDLQIKDLGFPSLFRTLFGTEDQGYQPVSGLMDHDYPNVIERGIIPNKLWNVEFQAPLPTDLENLALQAEPGTTLRMGLFPEIYRAWLTIDSDFYLWDFRDGSDLSYYDGLREPIVGMSLVPVKPNVFKSSIRHLICVTTASEIYLLGFILVEGTGIRGGPVSPNKTSMEIVSHPIFTLPTEAILFPVIGASNNGRIFLGGQDGSIHEIWYQAGRGWLRDRCGKTNLTRSFLSLIWPKFLTLSSPDPITDIVVDKSRNILFTLSLSGLIQVYDLGRDGTTFSNVGYMSFEVIVNSVVSISKKALEPKAVKGIISIAPIEYGEMNLVAVTDSGTRIYFTCFEKPHVVAIPPGTRPSTFQLVHVRLPPGYCPMSSTKKPDTAHRGLYTKGAFGLACTSSRDKDLLWLITPFIYPTTKYSELANLHLLPGVLHDMKEMPNSEASVLPLEYPDIITQHLNWQRQIVVLTSWGTTVFRAEKPFELLRDLLMEKKGPENIRSHFYMLPLKEHPLSNVLLIAIHPFLFSDNNLHDFAVKSIFLFGDFGDSASSTANARTPRQVTFDLPRQAGGYEPGQEFNLNTISTPQRPYLHQQDQFTGSPFNQSIGTPTMHSTFREQHSPFTPSVLTSPPSPQPMPQPNLTEFSYSPRHNAIYLLVGRILLPFWNRKIVTTGVVRNAGTRPTKVIVPNITGEEVAYALSFLDSIHKFLENNPALYTSSVKSQLMVSPDPRRAATNFEAEKLSLSHLKSFLGLTLEVLGMWQILCDHQFHIVLGGVDERLYNSTMKELVTGGHSAVAIIINALINKYLGDSTAVDAISLRLRNVCPTLFRNEDAIGSKVAEILTRAKSISDPLEKETLLKDSLVLSEQMCGQGRFDVRSFCQQFAALGYPLGAVRLCAAAARGADPNKLALDAFKSSVESSNDTARINAYRDRVDYYKIIFDILDSYVTQSTMKQSPLASRKSDDRLSVEKARQLTDDTIRAIVGTDDEAFHITLYNWLMDRKLFDRLLDIRHDYLDAFLKRAADSVVSGKWPVEDSGKNDTRILDLLWRHHEMNQNHQAAAQILSKLADTTTTGLNLQQRLEYLSRAVICGKSMGRQGDVLEIYEDKLEVAQIQKLILDLLQIRLGSISVDLATSDTSTEAKTLQDAVVKLNSQLFNITDLFSRFAHPFKLYEAHLEIFHTAGHAEPRLIEQVWSDIIQSEMSMTRNQSRDFQMEVVKRKMLTLGRKYVGSPIYFPTEYLIQHLETIKSPEVDPGWVFKIFLEIGVSFYELLQHYEKIWRKVMQNIDAAPGVDIQLARVASLMVNMFVRGELHYDSHLTQKGELVEKCTDLIASMIVEFSSRSDTMSGQLTNQLNGVKARLEAYR